METLQPAGKRDYLIDNLKFILIVLVVIGHFYGAYMDQNRFFKVLTTCIYFFHMPLFVFISGCFSKPENDSNSYKLTSAILLPYIFFCLMWDLKEAVHFKTFSFNIFNPPYHLWYLLCLFLWKLSIPIINRIKYPFIASLAISVLIGLNATIGYSAVLSRAFGLLPFFVLGVICPLSRIHTIHQKKFLMPFGILIILIGAYCILYLNNINFRTLLWDESYHSEGFSNLKGALNRIGLFFSVVLIGISFIILTPSKKVFFTSAGSRTLPIYIFHGFFFPTFLAHFSKWNLNIVDNFVIIAFPIALIYLLSLTAFEKFYKKIEFFLSRLFLIKKNTPLK
ncbi:acyltransferase family protein [Mucilaginibacter sp.]|uniref:acyltransferase family protein n=1 Tax=Mucilaginibacter sp. TaxID=1882438 RepID=UPI003D117F93